MTEQTQDPSLTVNDIFLAVQLIDIATERGAIRGEEITIVGNLRERFSTFLKANEPERPPASEQTEKAPTE